MVRESVSNKLRNTGARMATLNGTAMRAVYVVPVSIPTQSQAQYAAHTNLSTPTSQASAVSSYYTTPTLGSTTHPHSQSNGQLYGAQSVYGHAQHSQTQTQYATSTIGQSQYGSVSGSGHDRAPTPQPRYYGSPSFNSNMAPSSMSSPSSSHSVPNSGISGMSGHQNGYANGHGNVAPSYVSAAHAAAAAPKLCQYHGSASGCRYGVSCFLSHAQPNSVPVCKRHTSTQGCLYGADCWDRHWDFDTLRDLRPPSGRTPPKGRFRGKNAHHKYVKFGKYAKFPKWPPFSGAKERLRKKRKEKSNLKSNLKSQSIENEDWARRMDSALKAYYAECHRSDYADDNGRGKLLRFLKTHQMDRAAVERALGIRDENANGDDQKNQDRDRAHALSNGSGNLNGSSDSGSGNARSQLLSIDNAFPIPPKSSDDDEAINGDDDAKIQSESSNMSGCERDAMVRDVLRRCLCFGKAGILQRYQSIDWSLFERKEADVCSFSGQSPSAEVSEGSTCTHLQRMINALIYYSKFDIIDNDASKQQLMDLADREDGGQYPALLDDYMHCMAHHSESKHVDYLQQTQSQQFGLIDKCDINNCLLLFRASKEDEYRLDDDADSLDFFYRDLMDALHCYLVHSYDIGLRIKVRPSTSSDHGPHWTEWHEDKMYKYVCCLQLTDADVFVFCTSWCVARSH